jgi:hypothetical protein
MKRQAQTVEAIMKNFLNSKVLRLVMESGICRGGLKYVREHILITLLSVDSVMDEYELSRLSRCSLEQCKCVLETLKEANLLTIYEDGRVSLSELKYQMGFQKPDSKIILSEEEEKDLRVIIGDSFIFYKNMAQDYKMSLIAYNKQIKYSDSFLVLKAFNEKWDIE